MSHPLGAMPVCARPRRGPANRQTELSASVVKLVDTMDSKSIAFTGVAVRVRPLVPSLNNVEVPLTSEDPFLALFYLHLLSYFGNAGNVEI